MKPSLTIIKIVLTVASVVSIGTALGATVYFGVLKNNPPVVVQPTPTITSILTPAATLTSIPTVTPNIDISNWKTYKNEKYGFEFKYPKNLGLEEKTDFAFKSFSVFFKSDDLNGYILINNPGVGTGFDIAISSENILIDGINSKLQILDSSGDNERAGIVSFNKNSNDFFWLIRFDKSDANKLALVKKTFSTFAFTEKDNITDWKTYRNKQFGYEIKYPKDWLYKEDGGTIYFGTLESKSGGYIWAISVHQPSELEQLISQTGNQFNDRKETRGKITLNTNISGTLVTVMTGKYTNWISKKLYFEKNNQLFVIGNGAIVDDRFEIFYKSFNFYK